MAAKPDFVGAQLSPEDSRRLNQAIDWLVTAHHLDPDRAGRAHNALVEASNRRSIRRALLLYYATAFVLYEGTKPEGQSGTLDSHFLLRLDAIRSRSNDYDPLDIIARAWSSEMGVSKVQYTRLSKVTDRRVYDSTSLIFDDSASMHAINEYQDLRRHGLPADQAYDGAVTRQRPSRLEFIRQNILYSWGNHLLNNYDAFDAGKDSRDYLEAHYQYWRHESHPEEASTAFMASDPLAMLSRRVISAIRDDRKTIRIPLDAVIDSAIKRRAVAAKPPPETPSFIGLESASAGEMFKLARAVEDDPTTGTNYTHRLSVLRAYTATISQDDRDAVWGYLISYVTNNDPTKYKSATPDRIVAAIDQIRRTEGDEKARLMLDKALEASSQTFR